MLKLIGRFFLAILIGILVVVAFKFNTIKRLYNVIHLFDEGRIINNFQNMDEMVPVARLTPSKTPYAYQKNIGYSLPNQFPFNNSAYDVQEFLEYTQSEGLMIIQNDTIIYEDYWLGLDESNTHISWSMAKSIVSALLGIAYDDGLFQLNEPITKYLPQFEGTGYDSVIIKDILQMSTGVRFNEDYGDYNSDINRFSRSFALGKSLENFSKTMVREREPGTHCHYVSINTQMLGLLLKELTGQTLTDYYQKKLWEPLGMQDNGEWILDNTGMELALGGLNMSLRDYAKIGQLFLHQGNFNGQQLISKNWIEMSTTPDAPHVMPNSTMSEHPQGYGFQWWIPQKDEGDFFAVGIYNQFIYVQPEKNLVIVKLSANHHFKNEKENSKMPHIALFKKIASTL